jgi:hypothetical protein
MQDQAQYMGFVAEGLQHTMLEYTTSGRFFASIVLHEGGKMVKLVSEFLDDHLLMFTTDYPHPETRFPGSVDLALSWKEVNPDLMWKILWDNASRPSATPKPARVLCPRHASRRSAGLIASPSSAGAQAIGWNARATSPPGQVKLIGVHRHRSGICQGGRCRLLDVMFRQRSAFDSLFRGDGSMGSGRHTAQDNPVVETGTAFYLSRQGHGSQEKFVRLAYPALRKDLLRLRWCWGHRQRRDDLASLQDVLLVEPLHWGDKKLFQRQGPCPFGAQEMDLGIQGDGCRRHVRRVDDVTGAPIRDGIVIAVVPLDGPAHTPAFLQADNVPVAEIPAAWPLAEIASDRAGVAQLRRGHLGRRLHQEIKLGLDDGMFYDVDQAGHGPQQ